MNNNPLYFKTMKTKFILLGLLFSVSLTAQDIIITKDSKRIDAKIEEVSDEQIKYRNQDNLSGPLFVMSTNKIQSVLYQNGDVQIFDPAIKKQKVKKIKEPISIKHWFGISAGWVFRDRVVNFGDINTPVITDSGKGGYNFKQQSLGNTLQVGFTFTPTFRYGLGLYTGLYFEHTWAMKQINTWDPDPLIESTTSNPTAEDIDVGREVITKQTYKWFGSYGNVLYIPIHFRYKYDLNPNMNISASVGSSFELGLDKGNYKSNVNVLMGARFSLQLHSVQISVLTDWGISPEKILDGISAFYHRPISIQLSYMF